MGRIHHIELENFKSYGGAVYIGPFVEGFTAIIGPNGAGKSNLLDALSFGLGLPARFLRAKRLSELIHHEGDGEDAVLVGSLDQGQSQSVESKAQGVGSSVNALTVQQTTKVRLYMEVAAEQTILFERSVSLNGVTSNWVNGQAVSAEDYVAALAQHSILVSARNFLVFQNEVEDIANKSGRALSSLIEEVSGSAELRGDYEAALAQVRKAEQRLQLCSQKKKSIMAEKRQCREHREEAERYNELQRSIAEVKKLRMLFRIFHLEADGAETDENVRRLEREIEALRARRSVVMSELEEQKRGQALARREQAALEQRKHTIELALEHNFIQQAAIRTEARGLKKRIDIDMKTLESIQMSRKRTTEEISALESALAEIERALQSLTQEEEKSFEEFRIKNGMDSSAITKLREEAAAGTASMREMLDAAERAAAAAHAAHKIESQKLSSLERRLTDLEAEKAKLEMQIQRLEAKLREEEASLKRAREAEQNAQKKHAEQEKRREELEQVAKEYRERLLEMRCARLESERERRFHESIDQMMRLFPRVRGRVADLCRPLQRRYEEAISVIFGKLGEAIVVDDERAASECIAYLRQQRAGTATFLPLAELRPVPLDERLRSLGGTARLAIDVLEFDKSIFPAIQYVTGNALVCDSLDEARRMAYSRNGCPRVCTIDGTLIHRSGFITGGAESDRSASRTLWENEQLSSLKKDLDQVLLELAKLSPTDATREREQEETAHETILSTERRLEFLRQELQYRREQAAQQESRLHSLQEQFARAKASEARSQQELTECLTKVSEIKERIEHTEREILGDISPLSIHRSEEFRERRLALTTQQAKLRARLEYERAREAETRENDLVERIDKASKDTKRLQAELETLIREQQRLEDEAQGIARQKEHFQEQLAQLEESLQRKRDEEKDVMETLTSTESLLDSHRARKVEIAERLKGLQTDCQIGQIELQMRPRNASDAPAEREGSGSSRARSRSGTRQERTRAVEMETQPLSAATLDFSPLNEEYRAARTPSQREEIELRLCEQEQAFAVELERMAPNLRITEQLDEIQRRLDAVLAEQDAARTALTDANSRWSNIRNERIRRFRQCFEHISAGIDTIYRELTRSEAHPMGGSATITLESASEPYLGGIRFSVMPPAKRFRDVDQLSGGERSLAALALVFALHDYQKCPFLIMDEVDAALDPANVRRVAAYIRQRSSGSEPFQTIVISLKDAFFEFAHALVGVYRSPREARSSRVLTLDLEAIATERPCADPQRPSFQSDPATAILQS
jgi:structural maintenance of chromosome 1